MPNSGRESKLLAIDSSYYLINTDDHDSSRGQWESIGSHESDSGMTCIISASEPTQENPEMMVEREDTYNPYSETEGSISWTDFVIYTMDQPGTFYDPDEFPVFRFFGPIPDQSSVMSVEGWKEHSNDFGYSALRLLPLSDD